MKTWLRTVIVGLIAATSLFGQTATKPAGEGTPGNPYEIRTLENLYWVSQNASSWDKVYFQYEDIDASASSGWDGGAGWTPIGDFFTPFTGYYNGLNHTVSGIYISRTFGDYQGLFGALDICTVQDLGVINIDITGDQKVGGLVGYNFAGNALINCYSTGSVKGVSQVGGLVGYNNSEIANCYSTASVRIIGTGSSAGGLVGENNGHTISNSYSTGNVTGQVYTGGLVGANLYRSIINCHATGNVSGTSQVGGLVGYNWLSGASVSNCYSTGNVNGTGDYIGGLVGENSEFANVQNSYSTGNVSGYGQYVGGFLGGNSASISNCYSRGNVTRTSGTNEFWSCFGGINSGTIQYCYATGFVTCSTPDNNGFVDSNTGTCTANFFDTQTSGQSTGVGATAKITTEMKTHTTFTDAGWDFELETANGTNDYWDMDYSGTINNGYPFLSWQNGGDVSLPVELASFSARCKGLAVVLEWVTESEVDNLGFILERSNGDNLWQIIASYQTHPTLKGQGNTSGKTVYAYVDEDVQRGVIYTYRLSDVDVQGNDTTHDLLSITLDELPELIELLPAFPNPFNPRTKIQYTLSEGKDVTLSVLDMMGRTVQTIIKDRQQLAGTYSVHWNGKEDSGRMVSSGTYLLILTAGEIRKTQKVMIVR